MEKVVGNVVSKNSRKIYPVKWDTDAQTVWISKNSNTWEMVGTNVRTADSALSCAQTVIDSQPDLF